jgi:hypothetical protein
MMTNSLSGRNVRSCTVMDIANLAGVSTATVSRVLNGSGTVSREAKGKVLSAITGLQYCPNNHAAELGRGNRGIPRRRRIYTAGQLHLLEDENSRLRRLISDLTLDLELLKRASGSADHQ